HHSRQRPAASRPALPQGSRAPRSRRGRRLPPSRRGLRVDRGATAGARCGTPRQPEDQWTREAANPRRPCPADPSALTGISGHLYFAEKRTLLPCVDMDDRPLPPQLHDRSCLYGLVQPVLLRRWTAALYRPSFKTGAAYAAVAANTGAPPRVVIADKGYLTEDNLATLPAQGQRCLLGVGREGKAPARWP